MTSQQGLVALIVANYGIEYGIITPKLFAIIIVMVLVTTMQTVPLVHLIDPPSRAAQSAAEAKVWEDSMNNTWPPAAATAGRDADGRCETELNGSSVEAPAIMITPLD